MFLDEGTTFIVIEHDRLSNMERSSLRCHRATTNVMRGRDCE